MGMVGGVEKEIKCREKEVVYQYDKDFRCTD